MTTTVGEISDHVPRKSNRESNRRRLERPATTTQYSGDAIIGPAPDGIITSWNPGTEKRCDCSTQVILGKSSDLLSPKNRAGDIEKLAGPERIQHLTRSGRGGEAGDSNG